MFIKCIFFPEVHIDILRKDFGEILIQNQCSWFQSKIFVRKVVKYIMYSRTYDH